jgi:hypothetical protein
MSLDSDYARWSYQVRSHRQRYERYVDSMPTKLVCQECHGLGGETIPILDYGEGPFEECGWCEGTGYVTPWIRGLWLNFKRTGK